MEQVIKQNTDVLRQVKESLRATQGISSQVGAVKASLGTATQELAHLTGYQAEVRRHDSAAAQKYLNLLMLSAPQLAKDLLDLGGECNRQYDMVEQIAKTPNDPERRNNLQRQLNFLLASCDERGKPMLQSAYFIAQQLLNGLPQSQQSANDQTGVRDIKDSANQRSITPVAMFRSGGYLNDLIKKAGSQTTVSR